VILVVCTGNTCRSPMAEGLLRHHLEASGLDLLVASAGTLGWNERPASAHAVTVLHERGIDIAHHRSRKLEGADIGRADLVLVMTRVHGGAVVAHDEAARVRTFLPAELVRIAAAAGGRPAGVPFGDWVAELGAARPPGPLGRAHEEVADPAGESLDVYRATADRLERTFERLMPLLRPEAGRGRLPRPR
jgi:protein-tyrosine phosphatase